MEFSDEEEEEDILFEHQRFVVDKGQTQIRIDKFLMDRLQNTTRNKIQRAVDDGFIRVNDKEVKTNYKVKPLDIITIVLPNPPRDTEIIPENIPLNIVYEDDDLLIVNKVAGMVVHPAHSNWTGTLVNALAYHFKDLPQNSEGRLGLVHRIDKDTSGLLVIAKTEHSLRHLSRQFFDHSIDRTYQALIWGIPEKETGTINVSLGRNPKDRRLIEAFPEELYGEIGRRAITHYKVLKEFRYVSLIECKLETGRTHQIRAHMKYIGHPIFSDASYGGDKVLKGTVFSKYKSFVENCFKIIPRQALHAKSLGFIHPTTNERMFFESELPEDFKNVLEKWEHYVNYN